MISQMILESLSVHWSVVQVFVVEFIVVLVCADPKKACDKFILTE